MWSPDYPWGVGADYHEADRAALAYWGTSEYGRKFIEYQVAFGNKIPLELAEPMSRQSRNACTPDIAEELSSIWYASDVRAILPAVRCPTLLLSRRGVDDPEAKYVASLMPSATLRSIPEGGWSEEQMAAELDEIRSFIGIEPPAPALDSVLATVLFTDIVGSTAKQAALGDAALEGAPGAPSRDGATRNRSLAWH